METKPVHLDTVYLICHVGNPLLSERDGNKKNSAIETGLNGSLVGNPLLSERDGNDVSVVFQKLLEVLMSETHYSLKEMETGFNLISVIAILNSRKPTTL